MKQWSVLIFVLGLLTLSACNDAKVNAEEEVVPDGAIPIEDFKAMKLELINELEAKVWGEGANPDEKTQRQLLIAYSEWGNNFRDDERTPEYMFQGGRIAMILNKPRRAIELFLGVHDGFPKYEKRIESAYLVGFIYDDMIGDREMARKYYLKVIELYPESTWAESAKALNEQLYMTDDEIIKMFQEKNKAS